MKLMPPAHVANKPGKADLANKADSVKEALVIGDTNEAGINEANEATDATGANEADVVDKPGEADKAKAHKANKAANEADAEANKDYESKSCQGR
jgi:hypothetical protein